MTDEELAIYKRSGFVSIDQKRRHTFASGYYYIYASDLPVLITTDSILHAFHRAYDAILRELEASVFTTTVDEVLHSCHEELQRAAVMLARGGNPVLDQRAAMMSTCFSPWPEICSREPALRRKGAAVSHRSIGGMGNC